jgi:hypothetical protein
MSCAGTDIDSKPLALIHGHTLQPTVYLHLKLFIIYKQLILPLVCIEITTDHRSWVCCAVALTCAETEAREAGHLIGFPSR